MKWLPQRDVLGKESELRDVENKLLVEHARELYIGCDAHYNCVLCTVKNIRLEGPTFRE